MTLITNVDEKYLRQATVVKDYPAGKPVFWKYKLYKSVAHLIEECWDNGNEIPPRVWASYSSRLGINADALVEMAYEEWAEDCDDPPTGIEGEKELRAAIEVFNAAQTAVIHHQDRVAVEIEPRDEKVDDNMECEICKGECLSCQADAEHRALEDAVPTGLAPVISKLAAEQLVAARIAGASVERAVGRLQSLLSSDSVPCEQLLAYTDTVRREVADLRYHAIRFDALDLAKIRAYVRSGGR